jgi:SAM-dependent methyltransferase
MDESASPYYGRDLALVHHLGFGFHADACAPGILALLEPVRRRGGLVVEVGCGTGRLTRHLVDAGLRVLATDASPAMLELARETVPDAEDVRSLVLPDDPLPPAEAYVSAGHALNYLADEQAVRSALTKMARALAPGGVLALDLCDLEWARVRRDAPAYAEVTDEWTIVTRHEVPSPDRFVRWITTFIHTADGSWRRDDERHENILIDTSRLPDLLAEHGVTATVAPSFGLERLSPGVVAVVGVRHA